uniref:Uncharacterized protein C11orf87 n=1 Tax=Anthurium amnicola TaxID=1678845 RepID=A0A1D1YT71_9ARAE
MLVLRQTLLSDNLASPRATDVENAALCAAKHLTELLAQEPDLGIKEVVEALIGSSSEDKLQARREVMTRVLSKSLQAGDAVFTRVSRAVYLAARGVVLGGSGTAGRKMAELALQPVGGTALLDQVVEMADVLIVMAVTSVQIHRAWYECLLEA